MPVQILLSGCPQPRHGIERFPQSGQGGEIVREGDAKKGFLLKDAVGLCLRSAQETGGLRGGGAGQGVKHHGAATAPFDCYFNRRESDD